MRQSFGTTEPRTLSLMPDLAADVRDWPAVANATDASPGPLTIPRYPRFLGAAIEDSPGPGAYSVDRGLGWTKSSCRSYNRPVATPPPFGSASSRGGVSRGDDVAEQSGRPSYNPNYAALSTTKDPGFIRAQESMRSMGRVRSVDARGTSSFVSNDPRFRGPRSAVSHDRERTPALHLGLGPNDGDAHRKQHLTRQVARGKAPRAEISRKALPDTAAIRIGSCSSAAVRPSPPSRALHFVRPSRAFALSHPPQRRPPSSQWQPEELVSWLSSSANPTIPGHRPRWPTGIAHFQAFRQRWTSVSMPGGAA